MQDTQNHARLAGLSSELQTSGSVACCLAPGRQKLRIAAPQECTYQTEQAWLWWLSSLALSSGVLFDSVKTG